MRRNAMFAGVLLAVMASGPARAQAPAQAQVLSDSEKLSRADRYLREMRQALSVVLQKLQEAQASKDVLKHNCVTEKLTNVKGLMRISEQAGVALQEAIAKREETAADHELSKLTIAHQKVEMLRMEAEQCVGMLAFETGPTDVKVVEPEDLPQLDPTHVPPRPPVTGRPPAASPTK